MSAKPAECVELKSLQRRLSESEVRLRMALQEVTDAQTRASTERLKMDALRKQIFQLTAKDKPVVVTEHALLRYLERVCGVSMEETRKKILPEETEAHVKSFRTGTFGVAGSHKVKAKNGVVVTVLTNGEKE